MKFHFINVLVYIVLFVNKIMDICEMHSESEEGTIVSDFEEDFTEELCNLPHVLKFICKLRNHIKRQRKKINKLRNKLNEQVHIKFLIKYS